MASGPASKGNDRKKSDLLPDVEDLGKLLNKCSPVKGRKSNQGQTSDGKSCSTCVGKATFETIVQASSELTEHKKPLSGEVMLHSKNQGQTIFTRTSMQQQPRVQMQFSNQEPQTSFAKAAQQANEGMSTKAVENTRH